MEYVLDKENVHRFVDYANNVWGIFGEDDFEVAKKVITKTREFFDSLEIPSTLTDIGIDSSRFEEMATGATRLGPIGTMKKLNYKDVFIDTLGGCLGIVLIFLFFNSNKKPIIK